MLVWAIAVQTRVEFAHGLQVSEFAAGRGAVGSISAQWHARMLEWTVRVGAMREKSAEFFGLVCGLGGWRGVATRTLLVLARGAKRTDVAQVDGGALGSGRRLVGIRAILPGAAEVEMTNAFRGVAVLLGVLFHLVIRRRVHIGLVLRRTLSGTSVLLCAF